MITAVGTVLLLLLYFGYQYNFGNDSSLPIDYEQEGLADEIVIKFSHVVAESTPKGLAASKFAELVEEKTNGKIKVEVYPNSMLYSDDDEMRALLNNDIQMIAPSISNMTEIIPEWQVLDLPYLFTDYDDIQTIFTGDIGTKLLNSLQKKDIKGLALWSNGFKQMTSNDHPIRNVADFEGMQIRTMSSDMLQKQFTLLNAEPVGVSFDKVYLGLEHQTIDAQENTLSNIYSKGFYKVQHYLTISNHGFLGYAVMMNNNFWDSLPDHLQRKVKEAIDEATLWNLEQSEKMNDTSFTKIKQDSNLEIYTLSPKEQKEWADAFVPLYQYYQSEINASLIDEIKEEIR
ncbi:MAG: DctP family TRAP transporter solute-binding subunit [Bacillus sp. (in: firmicutes)]